MALLTLISVFRFYVLAYEYGMINDVESRQKGFIFSLCMSAPFAYTFTKDNFPLPNRIVAAILAVFIAFGSFIYLTRFERGIYISPLPGFLAYIALLYMLM